MTTRRLTGAAVLAAAALAVLTACGSHPAAPAAATAPPAAHSSTASAPGFTLPPAMDEGTACQDIKQDWAAYVASAQTPADLGTFSKKLDYVDYNIPGGTDLSHALDGTNQNGFDQGVQQQASDEKAGVSSGKLAGLSATYDPYWTWTDAGQVDTACQEYGVSGVIPQAG